MEGIYAKIILNRKRRKRFKRRKKATYVLYKNSLIDIKLFGQAFPSQKIIGRNSLEYLQNYTPSISNYMWLFALGDSNY